MEAREEIDRLAAEFEENRALLVALGDENRQHLLLEMLRMGQCTGVQVGDIAAQTHLSRPAVSHHIRILRDVGILDVRREGTKNYYYFHADSGVMDRLAQMLSHAAAILEQLSGNRGGFKSKEEAE